MHEIRDFGISVRAPQMTTALHAVGHRFESGRAQFYYRKQLILRFITSPDFNLNMSDEEVNSRLEKVREIIKKEAKPGDWQYHQVVVVKYAKLLAKKLGADEEMAELGALLHDIGRIRHGPDDHDVTGVPEAEKILKQVGYPKRVIEEIKHCVEAHRGSKDIPRRTLVAEIVANADAMAHFDIMPRIFHKNVFGLEFPEIVRWFRDKVDRNWNKKLTLPEAREMVREKYEAIVLLLDAVEEYL
jgi:putative nucleotidyltransferase with HDIG domain